MRVLFAKNLSAQLKACFYQREGFLVAVLGFQRDGEIGHAGQGVGMLRLYHLHTVQLGAVVVKLSYPGCSSVTGVTG